MYRSNCAGSSAREPCRATGWLLWSADACVAPPQLTLHYLYRLRGEAGDGTRAVHLRSRDLDGPSDSSCISNVVTFLTSNLAVERALKVGGAWAAGYKATQFRGSSLQGLDPQALSRSPGSRSGSGRTAEEWTRRETQTSTTTKNYPWTSQIFPGSITLPNTTIFNLRLTWTTPCMPQGFQAWDLKISLIGAW